MPPFERISYEQLNARQRENYNAAKLSAVLADYGFSTIRLSDDWQGTDLIAQHMDGQTFLKIQLKGRPVFYRKYEGKDLHIAFPDGDAWYIYPHDEVLGSLLRASNLGNTLEWNEKGKYVYPKLTKQLRDLVQPYAL